MLSYKREACIFINKVLGLKGTEYEISIDKLEKCDTSFITKSYYCKETDVIYRRTDMEVYFLIEHQSSVDSNMPARIVEYAVEILRDIIKNKEKENKRNKKLNKNTKISQTKQKLQPTIIPIVLYTGESKWNVKTYIREVQVEMPGYKNKEFGRYILVDANKYKEEELLKEEEALAKVVLLERSKNIEETYEKINQRKMDEYVEEIIKGKPIQYITHHQEFMELDFYVDENVLIPRQDTEILVEEVIKIANNHISDFESIAKEVITENGFDYDVKVEIGNFSFPTKQYGDISFPAGFYDALKRRSKL